MGKKSVGIITVHKSLVSYGASLQSYALWAYVNSIGFNCEMIDLYRPVIRGYVDSTTCLSFCSNKNKIKESKFKTFLKSIYLCVKNFSEIRQRLLKKKRFESFNSLIKYSRPYVSVDALYKSPPNYDNYLSGSDQIWNPDMPFEIEPYLLGFVPQGRKCISYASSFGRDNLPENIKPFYAHYLKRFSAISSREESGQRITKELIEKETFVALDPTMLFDKKHWTHLSIKPNIRQKYIFCFMLNYQEKIIKFAAEMCNDNQILVIVSDRKIRYAGIKIINALDCGPKEWLGLIENAEYVITDSFHGSIFSILFEKQFLSYVVKDCSKANRSTRIENLLNKLSLESRLLDEFNVSKYDCHIDYVLVKKAIDELRVSSKDFLNSSLK